MIATDRETRVFSRLMAERIPGRMETETPWNGSAFIAGVVNLMRPSLCIEVGCHDGSTSAYIVKAMRDNCCGRFVGYEIDPLRASAAEDKCADVWPGGEWTIEAGDFFVKVTKDAIDFAFIDIDPKEYYSTAFDAITWAQSATMIAHDTQLDGAVDTLARFRSYIEDRGWSCIELKPERGFLLAVRS